MQITSSNRVNVRLVHLDYILNGMGMAVLMNQFRAEESHRFLHWLQAEIKQLKSTQPDHQKVSTFDVPLEVMDVAIFMLSKLAYKILCDNYGRVVPTTLLDEIRGLEKFQEEAAKSRPRRIKGNIWDQYNDEDHWVEAVYSACKENFNIMVQKTQESEELEETRVAFDPKIEIIANNYAGAKLRTNESVVKLDITELIQNYGAKLIGFREPMSFSDGNRDGGFEHKDWNVALMAMLSLEIAESFRVFMMRHYRRVGDVDMYGLYKIQESAGFACMYKFLRENYVETWLKVEPEDPKKK